MEKPQPCTNLSGPRSIISINHEKGEYVMKKIKNGGKLVGKVMIVRTGLKAGNQCDKCIDGILTCNAEFLAKVKAYCDNM